MSTSHLPGMFCVTAQVGTPAASVAVTWLVLRSVAALAQLSTGMWNWWGSGVCGLAYGQDQLNATSVWSRCLFARMTGGNDCAWLSVAWEMETCGLCFQQLKSHPEAAVICWCVWEAVQCQPVLSVGDFDVWYTSLFWPGSVVWAEVGYHLQVQQLKLLVCFKNFLGYCPYWETCEFDWFLKLLCYTVGIFLARKPVETTRALVVCSRFVSGLWYPVLGAHWARAFDQVFCGKTDFLCATTAVIWDDYKCSDYCYRVWRVSCVLQCRSVRCIQWEISYTTMHMDFKFLGIWIF